MVASNVILKGQFLACAAPDGTKYVVPYWSVNQEAVAERVRTQGDFMAPGVDIIPVMDERRADEKYQDYYSLYIMADQLEHLKQTLLNEHGVIIENSPSLIRNLSLFLPDLLKVVILADADQLAEIVKIPEILALTPLVSKDSNLPIVEAIVQQARVLEHN